MKVLLTDSHRTLSLYICRMLDVLGHEVLLASWKPTNISPPPVSPFCYDYSRTTDLARQMYGKNVACVTKEECLDLAPTALWITNYESQHEILKEIAPKLPNSKLIFFSGNNYWMDWADWRDPRNSNYLFGDTTGVEIAAKYQLKNAHRWIPFIHSDAPFVPSLPNPVQITSFINGYSKHFNKEFQFFNRLKEVNQEIQMENIENQPPEAVQQHMDFCTFGLSIKGLEGIGYSNIELASRGRPVILHKDCCKNKALLNWMLPNQTAAYFNDGREFRDIVEAAISCPEWVEGVQRSCYRRIRELVNTEKEIETLRKFLENLV